MVPNWILITRIEWKQLTRIRKISALSIKTKHAVSVGPKRLHEEVPMKFVLAAIPELLFPRRLLQRLKLELAEELEGPVVRKLDSSSWSSSSFSVISSRTVGNLLRPRRLWCVCGLLWVLLIVDHARSWLCKGRTRPTNFGVLGLHFHARLPLQIRLYPLRW
jgi:hypothetical protein